MSIPVLKVLWYLSIVITFDNGNVQYFRNLHSYDSLEKCAAAMEYFETKYPVGKNHIEGIILSCKHNME